MTIFVKAMRALDKEGISPQEIYSIIDKISTSIDSCTSSEAKIGIELGESQSKNMELIVLNKKSNIIDTAVRFSPKNIKHINIWQILHLVSIGMLSYPSHRSNYLAVFFIIILILDDLKDSLLKKIEKLDALILYIFSLRLELEENYLDSEIILKDYNELIKSNGIDLNEVQILNSFKNLKNLGILKQLDSGYEVAEKIIIKEKLG